MDAVEILAMRKCSKCLLEKPSSEEFFNRNTIGSLKRQCRECTKAARKAWAIAKAAGLDLKTAACDQCRAPFEKASNAQLRCAPCRDKFEKARDQARAKRDTYKPDYAKAYYRKNADRILKYSSAWYRSRREGMSAEEQAEYRKRSAGHAKNRRRRNPLHFRVHDAMRKTLRGEYRSAKLEIILGYSIEVLAEHLEKQFLPGMTWGNIGEWHVDHILPQSMLRYNSSTDANFKQCWALANLRPLWADDNRKKSATRTHLI